MIHPEQVSSQIEQEQPWLRQRNEPAIWYMRFQRYLNLGPKRSLRKALAAETVTHQETKSNEKQPEPKKNLSNVSVPGAWSRASKVWNWSERAAAYDLAEQEKQAAQMRALAIGVPHASKPYRIQRLDYLARVILEQIKPGIQMRWCLAAIAAYQSLMRDIAKELGDMDEATMRECDAAAMATMRQEIAEHKEKKKTDKKENDNNDDIEQLLALFNKMEKN
jgi:hypothetical protein